MNIVVFSYNRRHKIKAIPLNYFFTYNKNPYRYFKTASSSRLAHWTHLYSIDGQIYPKKLCGDGMPQPEIHGGLPGGR